MDMDEKSRLEKEAETLREEAAMLAAIIAQRRADAQAAHKAAELVEQFQLLIRNEYPVEVEEGRFANLELPEILKRIVAAERTVCDPRRSRAARLWGALHMALHPGRGKTTREKTS